MSKLYPPSPDPSTYTSTGLSGSPGPSHPGTLGGSALVLRASSPTPSETRLLSQRGLYGPLNWASVKAYLRLKNIPYILGGVLILIVFILTISLNKKIAKALHPAGQTLRGLPGGWMIPVAVLVVVSFPPLLGHEIVAVFVGLVWGIGIGFGIVAFGTLLGELTNFYLFRYLFRKRAEGYERKNIKYGLLAHVVREGGFLMALMMRLSAIPSHFTTTVFSLTGMSSITFILAAIFSLPKQILGVAIGSMALTTSSSDDENSKIISGISIGGTAAVTLFAMWYTTRKIEAAKPEFVRLRRETRQASGNAEAGANLAESVQDFQPTMLREPIMAASVGLQASNTSYLSPPIPRVPHSYPPSP